MGLPCYDLRELLAVKRSDLLRSELGLPLAHCLRDSCCHVGALELLSNLESILSKTVPLERVRSAVEQEGNCLDAAALNGKH